MLVVSCQLSVVREQGGQRKKFLPITYYLLPITHYQLPITHYPLPITHSPLPIPHSPFFSQFEYLLVNFLRVV
ncbi:MAG: hypothetical protein HEQ29_12080 [Dolichospermum sp. LBC05a]|nr:hypothetical protein [Dolichospermum sp. OL01]MCO5797479.1 hypothetical protein [Dolichospermum sp. OL03]MCS6282579.1 hypothetical protein [Dolichospermum sp.]QSV59000.1 MAG: hypothetical protein HEQ29_12080 [Dolichospermum sp. LBC05a]